MIKNILIFVLFCPCFLFAQNDTTQIQTSQAPKISRLNKIAHWVIMPDTSPFKHSINILLDSRNSYLKTFPAKIHGIVFEYKLKKKVQVGIGGFTMNRQYDKYIKSSATGLNHKYSVVVNLYYISPNIIYTFFKNRWIELSIPVELGGGVAFPVYTSYETGNVIVAINKDYFIPAEAGLAFLFKLNRWIGFKASTGYRKILWQTSSSVKDGFDGLYYNYGVNVFFGTVLKDVYSYYLKSKKQE
jgi:hypothetical protein